MPKATRLAGSQGFSLTKQHGQHLLKNPLVVKNIIERSEIRPTDVILEIGPGTGNLTIPLLQAAKQVIAIEIDPRMVTELKKRVSTKCPELKDKLTVIHGDFCKMKDIPKFDMCISNCPYNVSSDIVFKLLSVNPPPRKHVLMFQLEFAQSLAAEPGQDQYSRLTVNTRLLAKTKIIIKVSKNSFRPPPKVDSAVIEIVPTGVPEGLNLAEWEGMTRILFNHKNKTLSAIFKQKDVLTNLIANREVLASMGLQCGNGPNSTKEDIENMLTASDLAPQRPIKMSGAQLMDLLAKFTATGIRFVG